MAKKSANETVTSGLTIVTVNSDDAFTPLQKGGRRASELSKALDALEVGKSIAIKTDNPRNVAVNVGAYNRKKSNQRVVTDENGAAVMVAKNVKDVSGAIISTRSIAKTEAVKYFSVHNVDASTDPAGANVRVVRDR